AAPSRRNRPGSDRSWKGDLGSELLIPCGDLSSPWNRLDPKRSDGVVEYSCFQHSNIPLLHRSGSLIFHRGVSRPWCPATKMWDTLSRRAGRGYLRRRAAHPAVSVMITATVQQP